MSLFTKADCGHGGRGISNKFRAVMNDEELCDVRLQGTDGESIPAARFVLAAQSRVFRKMLYGDFAESSSPVVAIGFKGSVVRLVVEYCYTDTVESLNCMGSDETVRTAVNVYTAANYLELSELEGQVAEAINGTVLERPALACAVIDEAFNAGALASDLLPAAWRVIRQNPKRALLPLDDSCGSGVVSLGPDLISEVIHDHHTSADELTLLKCLKKWADASDVQEGNGDSAANGSKVLAGQKRPAPDVEASSATESRHSFAKKLVKKIRLSLIPPSDLVGFVSRSDIVEPEDIASALRDQALFAEKEGIRFSRPRADCVLVQGAGVPAVNGIYILDDGPDTRSRASSYTKSEIWKGREELFVLSRSLMTSRHGSERGTWFISMKHMDGDKSAPFYFSRNNDMTKSEWAKTGEGIDPPPEVRRC